MFADEHSDDGLSDADGCSWYNSLDFEDGTSTRMEQTMTNVANESTALVAVKNADIQSRILTIRGVQVMLDRDLAALYGVDVKR